jgi:two-component system phosphate regulon sensor histidine kinase PhoR
MSKKRRLLWQLYPSYLLITVISLLAATWYASKSFKAFYLEQAASDLQARALLLQSQILEYLDPLDPGGIDRFCKKIGTEAATRVTVILPSGEVAGDSEENPSTMDNHADRTEVRQALAGHLGSSARYSRTLDKDMMYVGVPLKRDGRIMGVIRTSIPLTSVDKAVRSIDVQIAFGGLLIAILAAVLSLIISRRISRPLEEMKQGAERFSRGDLDHRLPLPDSEEMGGLAEALNEMAGQLGDRMKTVLRQRNELEAVVSSMVEGVIAVDVEERVISMNQGAAQMLACNPWEAVGKSIQEVVRNTDLQQFVRDTLTSDTLIEREMVHFSQEERHLNGHGTPLKDEEGNRIGALIVLNDVTRIKRLEAIRRDFVANVSHEIKTPITAIMGFVETLRQNSMKGSDEADRFLGIIEKHANRLKTIIEDLLSLSRIEQEGERGEILLQRGALKELLHTAIQVCQPKAEEKQITVALQCDKDVTASMNSRLLEQAFVNLLDNAIKYSEQGSEVMISAQALDGDVAIRFQDHGIGIEKDHIPRLFERFYRVDRARSRKLGGTGLGLAIVKHIVQAHGGRIQVESTLGKGSIFCIYLPKG